MLNLEMLAISRASFVGKQGSTESRPTTMPLGYW